MKQIKDIRGFTLIELILAIALAGLLLALVYSLLFYGNSAFQGGTEKAFLQQEARIVEKWLTNHLRNVDGLILAPAGMGGGFDNSCYVESQRFYHQSTALTKDVIQDIQLTLDQANGAYYLSYRIIAGKGNQEYQLTGQILLNNAGGNPLYPDGLSLTSNRLYY